MKACRGVSGILGPARSRQLGREEEHWRWLLGRQGSLAGVTMIPSTKCHRQGQGEGRRSLAALSSEWMSPCSILFALGEKPRSNVAAASQPHAFTPCGSTSSAMVLRNSPAELQQQLVPYSIDFYECSQDQSNAQDRESSPTSTGSHSALVRTASDLGGHFSYLLIPCTQAPDPSKPGFWKGTPCSFPSVLPHTVWVSLLSAGKSHLQSSCSTLHAGWKMRQAPSR